MIGALILALIAGIAIGVLLAGFVALGAYRRGYADGRLRRKEWRAEIVARQAASLTRPTRKVG